MSPTPTQVLVTGGSGFIAGHCILALLEQGHSVRATVRSLGRESAVRRTLENAGMTRGDALTVVEADLTDDAGWAEAVRGCTHVLHMASPVMPGHVENEDDVIVPAREGTLRVLRAAAADGGVARVVLTSAFHAVGWGHRRDDHVFTEDDWTVLDGPGSDAYARAKTLAERAAWDFVAESSLELVTVLPVAVIGPVMGSSVSGANHLVQRLLTGGIPVFPDVHLPVVDVRDVASAHVLAMTVDDAAGHRFLLASDPAMSMKAIGGLLRDRLGPAASKVPTRSLPSFLVRLGARFNPEMRAIASDLGYARRVTGEKARRVLGWQPRPSADAVVAAGQSMIDEGLVAGR